MSFEHSVADQRLIWPKAPSEAAGIEAMIQADTAGGMRPHLAWAGSGFKLLVREEDAGAARDLLESSDQV